MNVIESIQQSLYTFLRTAYPTISDISGMLTVLNVDEQKQHFGDLSCNAALVLAKQLQQKPQQIAQHIAKSFKNILIERIEVAGPGFLNIFLTKQAFEQIAHELYDEKATFFADHPALTKKKYLIEFVSANPTGPLHLGHGRGGIIGDVLGNILRFIGNEVIKEYYINDAGSQIQKLGASFKIRCLQQLGIEATIPEDGYHGSYLIDLAQQCVQQNGKALLEKSDDFFSTFAKDQLLADIKQTLHHYGISFDVWFSEKTLHDSNAIILAFEILQNRNTVYEQDGALWFRSTDYADDKDRVLRKSNGELTYIAADVAYTQNKFSRADHLILVLGQDHHSYVVRLKGIAKALGYDPDCLDVILYQLVTLKEGGEQLRMSKRAGTMVTLQEIIDTVGTDVARFFFLNRKADAHLDFDIGLALKKTEENPVYYIQYAYVRTHSIMAKAHEHDELKNIQKIDVKEFSSDEHLLLKKIVSLKELLADISNHYQTHLLTYYVHELAQYFHHYYSRNRVIDLENIEQSRSRLLLIQLLHDTFGLCLDLLGLGKPTKM